MADLTILRTPTALFSDLSGATGRRLELVAHYKDAKLKLPAIERGPGWVYVKPGTYMIEMQDHRKFGRILRIFGNPVFRGGKRELINTCLFHAANMPKELAGCIAPGKAISGEGVFASREAMETLFHFLGGFKPGRKLILAVRDIDEQKTDRPESSGDYECTPGRNK